MATISPWYGWTADGRAEGSPEGRANRFAWFRRVVYLDEVPADAWLRIAADSTARWWVNGTIISRQSTRYHRHAATCDQADVAGILRPGANVVVALLHHWGPITCFQRSAGGLAGLWADAPWFTHGTWRVQPARAFRAHTKQILGTPDLTPRIRFPQIVEAAALPGAAIHTPDWNDQGWEDAVPLTEIPWPAVPAVVEGPLRHDVVIRAGAVVAAGLLHRRLPLDEDPALIGPGITTSTCVPDADMTQAAVALLAGQPWTISADRGESRFVTLDFQRILHGYPRLRIAGSPAAARIDLGYGELWQSQRTGRVVIDASGWLDAGAVVGARLGDRIIIDGRIETSGCEIELPDERTARWLTVHIHFREAGTITIQGVDWISSQHPCVIRGSCEIADVTGAADPTIAQIIDLCLDHAAVTMTDVLVDTPGREDGQWLEDATPRAELQARWTGDTSLRQRFLRLVAESQNAEGIFHLFPPASFAANWNLWDWQMQWGQMLWEEWRWSGDPVMVRRYWPTLQRAVTAVLVPLGADGLWRSDRIFADIRNSTPVPPGGVSGIVMPWLIARLPRWAELAEVVGHDSIGAQWRKAAAHMQQAFTRHLVVPNPHNHQNRCPYLIADTLDAQGQPLPGFGQAAHTEALAEGLVEPGLARKMLEFVFSAPCGSPPADIRRWNNPTTSERALRALSVHGLGARALAHLGERYAQYLPGNPANLTPLDFQGPRGGPLPEYWISRRDLGLAEGILNPAQPDDETGSHGWGAVPLLWLHERVLGVRWQRPGGSEVIIAPDRCGRPAIRGRTCTPRGEIAVAATARDLHIDLPPGVSATVAVPLGAILREGTATALPHHHDGQNGWWHCPQLGPYRWELPG